MFIRIDTVVLCGALWLSAAIPAARADSNDAAAATPAAGTTATTPEAGTTAATAAAGTTAAGTEAGTTAAGTEAGAGAAIPAAPPDLQPQPQPPFLPELTANLPPVDRVVVRKAARRLQLMHGGNVVRDYPVRLGLNPVGQKERAGDFRTPEGSYRLERRNPRSDFFLSIRVSYPSPADVRFAHRRHWDAGGSIMIHGLPNVLKHTAQYYQNHDWTDGCIAVSNSDMVEVWMLTPDDAPIDILP